VGGKKDFNLGGVGYAGGESIKKKKRKKKKKKKKEKKNKKKGEKEPKMLEMSIITIRTGTHPLQRGEHADNIKCEEGGQKENSCQSLKRGGRLRISEGSVRKKKKKKKLYIRKAKDIVILTGGGVVGTADPKHLPQAFK